MLNCGSQSVQFHKEKAAILPLIRRPSKSFKGLIGPGKAPMGV